MTTDKKRADLSEKRLFGITELELLCLRGVCVNYGIEVCIKEGSSTTEKGRLLEDLAASVLKVQQYEITETLRVTGMEIDVLAEHKVSKSVILVECKAHEDNLPSDVISKLLGNTMIRGASAGWLLSTGPLSKDAEGLRSEWESRTDTDRSKLSFYTSNRVIELLLDARIITSPVSIKEKIKGLFIPSDNNTLMITDIGMYWLIPIVEEGSEFVTSVVVFDAKTGHRIISKDLLEKLKVYKNSYSSYQWLEGTETDKKASEQLLDEYQNIVPVISGDDWADYRPARPEDFVGRRTLIDDMYNFFADVSEEKSQTRLFSIKAPSGMGKSSIVLKIASIAQSHRKAKNIFIYAVDVRTAMSSRYVEMALKACFDKADSVGFTDTRNRDMQFTNISSFMQSDSVISTLSHLKSQKKVLILIFDQFEELFSKKELFGLFDNIRVLSNILDAQKQNFVLGFSWKTDLSIPAEHPAYYMWSNLSDRRREFEVAQFKQSEIKSAVNMFGKQLGEKINPVLSNYLIKQCQGYPWLLKKLCVHVFNLIKEGGTQEAVIGRRLNIVDLFDKDISELTPEEHACIIEIAKDSPADFFRVVDLYGNDVVTSLVNRRIVIRRASRLTLYWDIFRDYVTNKTIPTIVLDYIPQQQFSSMGRLLSILLKHGDMTPNELSLKTNLSTTTIDNIMIDVVMAGVAKRENGMVSVIFSHEDQIIRTLQSFFMNHILYNQIALYARDGFNYLFFSELFNTIYEHSEINSKTKKTYCAKMLNWFIRLGLVYEKNALFYLGKSEDYVITLESTNIRRRGRYSASSGELFWGQASPEKMIDTYQRISKDTNSYVTLKSQGLRNAIEVLSVTQGISKDGDILTITKSLEEIFKFIKESPTIIFAISKIEAEPDLKSRELGEILNDRFNRGWAESSKQRYGNALLIWSKYIQQTANTTH